MGSRRKWMNFQDEIEHMQRRRSNRIIALEEKKEKEKERKLALAMERKNKAKDKATIKEGKYNFDYVNENDNMNGPNKKGRKSKAIHQLICLIKSMQEGQCFENASTSKANVSYMNSKSQKDVLEFIIDLLQRKDPDELFAEPSNPDKVENYHEIVKQPMDFGTMRAKLHKGMYTNLEQFKCDVDLICSNAMNAHPATSKYHKVAEAISGQARRIFEGLLVDPEHFGLELTFINKKQKSSMAQLRSSRHSKKFSTSKPVGRKNSTVPEFEKRDMYWPPSNKPLVAEFLNANKPNIHLDKDPSNYKDSLLRFVKDLGPTAQRVAAKKLEVLNYLQLCNNGYSTPIQNLLQNVSSIETVAPIQQLPDSLSSQTLSLTLPSLNKPLSIPGTSTATQEKRNVNTTAASVNLMDTDTFRICLNPCIRGDYKGKKACTNNDQWQAHAASLLSNSFINDDKGGSGNKNITCSNNNIGGSNNNVYSHVYPSLIISGPQPKPLDYSILGNSLLSPQDSSISFMPNQCFESGFEMRHCANTSRFWRSNPSLFGIDTQYQTAGDLQTIMNSPEFNNNNNSHTMQPIHDFQMELISPLHEPNISSPALEIDAMSCYGGGGADLIGQPEEVTTPQLIWDNDDQPDLALQL